MKNRSKIKLLKSEVKALRKEIESLKKLTIQNSHKIVAIESETDSMKWLLVKKA